MNGLMNGIVPVRRRCRFVNRDNSPDTFTIASMQSPDPATPQDAGTPATPGPSNSKSPHSVSGRSATKPSPQTSALSIPFEEQPAIIRTPGSMSLFLELDREVKEGLESPSEGSSQTPMLTFDTKGKGKESLVQRLHSLIDDDLMEIEEGSSFNEDDRSAGDALVGQRKRKRYTLHLKCLQLHFYLCCPDPLVRTDSAKDHG